MVWYSDDMDFWIASLSLDLCLACMHEEGLLEGNMLQWNNVDMLLWYPRCCTSMKYNKNPKSTNVDCEIHHDLRWFLRADAYSTRNRGRFAIEMLSFSEL